MEDDLINKIKHTVSKAHKEESDIVYLMVKIRKMLEKSKNNKHQTLKAYCDWSLHNKITENKTCQRILKEIEKEYKKQQEKNKNKIFDPFLSSKLFELDIFKEQLESFLKTIGIPKIFSNKGEWLNFRKLFIDNIADCPIEPKNTEGLIEKFSFKKSSNHDINFEIKLFNTETSINGSFSEREFEISA